MGRRKEGQIDGKVEEIKRGIKNKEGKKKKKKAYRKKGRKKEVRLNIFFQNLYFKTA